MLARNLVLFTLACPPVWLDKGIWPSLKWAGKKKKVGREGFPGDSVVKNPPQCRDVGLTSGSGRSPGWWDGHPLQCSCLEDPMDRGAWWATVHKVAKSWTWLSDLACMQSGQRIRPKILYANCLLTNTGSGCIFVMSNTELTTMQSAEFWGTMLSSTYWILSHAVINVWRQQNASFQI